MNETNAKKKAVIIGASSGIGKSLIPILIQHGYHIGISSRRIDVLHDISHSYDDGVVVTQAMDVSDTANAITQLHKLSEKMQGIDLLIISAGIGHVNPSLEYSLEQEAVKTNVEGFLAICNAGFHIFKKQGYGHIVAISSIAGLRGISDSPAYSASKSFISNYLEGLRVNAFKHQLNINILDVRPGFVDTKMAKGDNLFWVASPELVAKQIFHAIQTKKKMRLCYQKMGNHRMDIKDLTVSLLSKNMK